MRRLISRCVRGGLPVLLRRFRDLSGDEGGSFVEIAILTAFLCAPLLFGTTDVAVLIYSSIEISSAAHAGVLAGIPTSADADNSSAITAAAQAEASDFAASSVTVTPTTFWVCNTAQGGTQYSTQSAANTGCTSPAYALEFVQVTVSAPVKIPFHCCGLPSSATLTRRSVMEREGQP